MIALRLRSDISFLQFYNGIKECELDNFGLRGAVVSKWSSKYQIHNPRWKLYDRPVSRPSRFDKVAPPTLRIRLYMGYTIALKLTNGPRVEFASRIPIWYVNNRNKLHNEWRNVARLSSCNAS